MKHVFEDEEESETLLHIAVKYSDDSEMIRRIVKMCPELLTISRGDSKNYKGQTPLHIAITKRDYEVTKLLLSDSKQMKSILKTKATGSIFTNTVMMGELPLHVAALTLDENIMEILLDKKPKMRAKNSCGDTVFHSLVKYAAIYPNKSDSVIKMLTYLTDKIKKKGYFK
ncbi:unnamed protein product [Mytilus edulis]|uniref:Uncharacterized protein n=1 Tax=Mytilus edulis TaxID=6550 RepID=A0A8S3Q599_MYTED|nr:unnamed protein product [Mytilus edulis]